MSERQIDVRRHISIACYILVGFYLLIALYLLSGLTRPGWFYRSGVPVGADFVQIWSASSLAAQGRPALVYNAGELKKVETGVIGGDFPNILPFHYPPSFLLLVRPLSSINYLAALAAWLFLPLGALLLLLYRIYPDRLTVWAALAFMGTAENLLFGQGAFLIGSLLGGGLLLLESYPILGGICFSLILNYKPHIGLLIPVVLLASRNWRALGAMAAGSAVLILASAWLFGLETWLAYGKDLLVMRAQLAEGGLYDRMPTIFGAVRLWGGGHGLALALQGLAALGVTASVYRVWRGSASLALRAAILVLGALLVTPHALNYDLTLLLLPIAWVAREGLNQHMGKGTILMLLMAWLIPFLNSVSVPLAGIHLAPIIMAAFLIYLLVWAASGIGDKKPITTG